MFSLLVKQPAVYLRKELDVLNVLGTSERYCLPRWQKTQIRICWQAALNRSQAACLVMNLSLQRKANYQGYINPFDSH